jgi:hypothetical protein
MLHSYVKLVPIRFRTASGIEGLTLQVLDPWFYPFTYVRNSRGVATRISPAAYCALASNGYVRHLLIDLQRQPFLAKLVLSMGQLLFTHTRADKYLLLYKVYESLEPRPDIRFAAVRHALSHAPIVLSRPGTVRELRLAFGTVNLNLENPRHALPFYKRLAELLAATDQRLAVALTGILPNVRVLRARSDALFAWQVKGVPGLCEPIPVA